ncbi:hypothetical protein GUITHDRAFT_116089 [Guillardia theta CCMP2712]|uniref:Uncharacterized protein n=1 Tax=Guillardia theta (strain CCMP2712) TaxID=905079 RepID=L1IPK1_GUITC|nr:hypothetical protein GUITHDRAFT_116089 [Guillardia theta CCMP2712]EKX37784.1 hypothetical protein GUITHDRAFT_116089 [Guillardia theta CCMP2712]|eukprot:XP_005824764.1 hypothetical protein GUITHDRAFT_116089 [Guillardia theta CCMP2712]
MKSQIEEQVEHVLKIISRQAPRPSQGPTTVRGRVVSQHAGSKDAGTQTEDANTWIQVKDGHINLFNHHPLPVVPARVSHAENMESLSEAKADRIARDDARLADELLQEAKELRQAGKEEESKEMGLESKDLLKKLQLMIKRKEFATREKEFFDKRIEKIEHELPSLKSKTVPEDKAINQLRITSDEERRRICRDPKYWKTKLCRSELKALRC